MIESFVSRSGGGSVHAFCNMPFLLALIVCFLWKEVPAQNGSGQSNLESRLTSCIANYENGEYQKVADSLERLATALVDSEQQIKAYKYLAYSYAMLNRIEKSKAIFEVALKKHPAMNIDTLEAPPNIAIIFKQVKLEKKIETINLSHPKTIVVLQKKNVVVPTILFSCSILCIGAAVDLLYYGNQQHQQYKSITTPDQDLLDGYYSRYRNATIAGAVSLGVSAVLLPVSIYLFTKKDHRKKNVSLSFINGHPSIDYSF